MENIPNEELTLAYLRALASECSELPLGIVDPRFLEKAGKGSITLPGVYIDLDVQPPSTEERTKQKPEESIFERERENRMPVLEALTDSSLRHLVLLGDPGSGKTTCLHYLTYALSLSQQKDPSASELFPEDWQLKEFFPIRLVLREVAAQHIPAGTKRGSPDIIWNALRAELTRLLGNEIAMTLFPKLQERILKQPCLLMLDGLDEVTETDSRRERLIEAIALFTALLSKESCVLVTARPYAYTDSKWRLPGFKTLTLLPFNEDQIERFISRWYLAVRKSMKWDETAANERGQSLNGAVKEKEYLFDLAARPLLLTLMATLHTSWGKLPEDRADLYDQIVSLLLDRWQRWRDARDQDGNLYTEKSISIALSIEESNIRKALNQLAYTVHTRQGHDDNRQPAPADIRQEEVLDAFSSYLPDTVHPRVIINYLETRAGLLLGRGNGIYSFPHRSFQEYLAACYLNDLLDPATEYSERIQQDPAWWREVFLLGIGKMSRGGLGTAIAALQTLWLNLPMETERTDKDWQAVSLAGQAVTEMKLGADTTRYEKLIAPIRNSLVALIETSRLTPRERAEAGDTLAKLGDPRFGETHWQLPKESLLGFVHIPAGEFLMGTKEEDIKGLIDKFGGDEEWYKRETPQHPVKLPDYYMARYPVTVAQFKAFIEDSKYKPQDENSLRGHPNHPVVYVTWYDALEYCKWLTAKLKGKAQQVVHSAVQLRNEPERSFWQGLAQDKLLVTLPSEAEWEKAARHSPTLTPSPSPTGRGERIFPWGDDFDQNKVNNNNVIGSTSAVGCFPQGKSPYEIHDMSGNVWEWTRSEYKEYPFDPQAKLEKIEDRNILRVLRGGAFDSIERSVRCAVRGRNLPGDWYDYGFGFRVVVVASPISL